MLFSPDGLSSPPLSKLEGQYGIGALGSTGGMSEGFPSCSQVLFQVILCCLSLVKTDCGPCGVIQPAVLKQEHVVPLWLHHSVEKERLEQILPCPECPSRRQMLTEL